MTFKNYFLSLIVMFMSSLTIAQENVPNEPQGVADFGESLPMFYVPSMANVDVLPLRQGCIRHTHMGGMCS